MRIGRVAQMAKKAIDSRGGTEGLKRDAEQLKGIAQGQGSAKEKARKAADALKQPKAPEQHVGADPADKMPEHGGADRPGRTQG